jgi:hypothetical protein
MNRRDLLAGAAAVAAVPTASLAKAGTDPATDLADALMAARAEMFRISALEDQAEGEAVTRFGWPTVSFIVVVGRYHCCSEDEILMRAKSPEITEAAIAKMRAARAQREAWEERTGVAPWKRRSRAASDATDAAAARLCLTRARTPAGIAAKLRIALIPEDDAGPPCDWEDLVNSALVDLERLAG